MLYRGYWSIKIYTKFKYCFSSRHNRVNKKRVNVSSYLLKDSDQVEVNDKSKKLNIIDGSIQSKEREIPEYIQLDGKSKSVKLIRVPKFSEVPYPVIMEPNLVIEYYSR